MAMAGNRYLIARRARRHRHQKNRPPRLRDDRPDLTRDVEPMPGPGFVF
jgi:hypothetical protein